MIHACFGVDGESSQSAGGFADSLFGRAHFRQQHVFWQSVVIRLAQIDNDVISVFIGVDVMRREKLDANI